MSAPKFPALGGGLLQEIFVMDYRSQDGKAVPSIVSREPEGLLEWFKTPPEDGTVMIRLVCVRISPPSPESDYDDSDSYDDADRLERLSGLLRTDPLDSIVTHTIWGEDVYRNLVTNAAGGASGLANEPWRFILQTPLDGGPFCSLALARHRNVVKGVLVFDDASVFGPEAMSRPLAAAAPSSWRQSGLQVVSVPLMVLGAQGQRSARALADVVRRVRRVEAALGRATELPRDHVDASRALSECDGALCDIERRSRFETAVAAAVGVLAEESRQGPAGPGAVLAARRGAVDARAFDFETLPRRIANARATLAGLMQQRNEELNLELARSSERIAEATLSDSKTMKTIAVLTMVFLPATAVASVFSMSVFDWSSESGGGIASKWVWVYFVVAVPLTVIVLGMWVVWERRTRAEALRQCTLQEVDRFRDADANADVGCAYSQRFSGNSGSPTDDIEMQVTGPSSKVTE